jgi:hypothetical protein
VTQELSDSGKFLQTKISRLLEELKLTEVLGMTGHPSWTFLTWSASNGFTPDEIKTYFAQLMYENGLLILSTHNISLSHSGKILDQTIKIYEKVLLEVSSAISEGSLKEKLKVEPLLPLFKVR